MAQTAVANPPEDRNDKDIFTGLVRIGPFESDVTIHASSIQQAAEIIKQTYAEVINIRAGYSHN